MIGRLRLTSKRKAFDTVGSALTGRPQPAAREDSHLFWPESCARAPSFSLVSAGHRRLMKGGRNDRFEVSPRSPVSRVPPQTGQEARARSAADAARRATPHRPRTPL